MGILSVEVRLVWGLVQHGTCAFVGLWTSTCLVAWIVVVRPRSLSEQPVLPKLLADLEEWVMVQF